MASVEEAASDPSSLSSMELHKEQITSRDCSNGASTSDEINQISGDSDAVNDTEKSLKKNSGAVNRTEAKDNAVVQDHQDKTEGEILVTKSEVLDTSTSQEAGILRNSEEPKTVDVQEQESDEHVESGSLEIKDERRGREESGESEEFQDADPETFLIDKTGSKHVFEEISSDKEELKDENTKLDQIQELQKPSIEVSSEESEETSTKVDEKIREKPEEEEVRLHQESNEGGSYGVETKEEIKSVPEVAEKAQEEEETELQKVEIEKQSLVEETPDEITQISSVSVSENEAEQAEDKIQKSLEIAETEDQEQGTVSEKTEDEKVKETETTDTHGDLSLPLEASRLEDEKLRETEYLEEEEEEFRNLEAVKLEESKEDKSPEILETTEAIMVETSQEDQTPKEVKEIHKEETMEANKLEVPVDQILSSELVSGLDEQNPKEVKEIHEEERKEADKVESMADLSLQVETSKVDQTPSSELVSELNDQTPKKIEEIHEQETKEAQKLEAMTEIVSGLDDQTPELVKEIHQEETKEEHKLDTVGDQSVPVNTSELVSGLDDQRPKHIEEETKEADKLVVAGDQSLLIQTPQEHQTPSSELVSELDDQTPKQVEEIDKEETKEEHKLDVLPVGALQAEHNSSSELVSRPEDDAPKQVEEIHAEDTEESDKLEARGDRSFAIETSQEDQTPKEVEEYKVEEIDGAQKLETDIDQSLPVETSMADQTPSSELVSKLDDETQKQFDETPKHIEEIHEGEAKKDYELEVTRDQSLPVETSKANQTPSSELVSELNSQTPNEVQEIHEEETKADKLEAKSDQSLVVETSQVDQTPPSELASELNDQTPKLVEIIHEEDVKDVRNLEATSDQSLLIQTPQEHQTPSSELVSELNSQTPNEVQEIHEEETKEERKLEAVGDRSLPVVTSQEEDDTSKQVEEIYDADTKETHMLEATDEDKTPKQVEEYRVEEIDGAHKLEAAIDQADQSPLSELDDQTPKKVEEIQEEETKQAPKLQAEEIPLTETIPREAPVSMLASKEDEKETLQESNDAIEVKEANDTQEEQLVTAETEKTVGETKPKESKAEGAETSDDTYSTLPVVGILKELQTTLETERETENSASSGEKIEATEKYYEPSFEAELETTEKHPVTNEKQGTNFEAPAAEEFEVSVEEKLQEGEEEAREINENKVDRSLTEALPCEKILLATSAEFSKEPEHEFSAENQEEHKAQVEKTSLQEEKSRDFETSSKVDDVSDQIIEAEVTADQPESHETVEKDQISDIKEEKEDESHSVLGNEVEIDAVITPEKQITEPLESIKKANEAEHESTEEQAPKDQREEVHIEEENTKKLEGHGKEDYAGESLTKEVLDEQLQVPSSAFSSKEKQQVPEEVDNSNPEAITTIADQEPVVQKPSEINQSQSPNLPLEEKLEETSFEVKKVQEDKDMENVDDVAIKETIHVQNQPREFEVAATNEETNLKLEVPLIAEEDKALETKEVKEEAKNIQPTEETHKDELNKVPEQSQYLNASPKGKETIKNEVSGEDKSERSEEIPAEKKTEDTMFLQKETSQECVNKKKNIDETTEETKPEVQKPESLSSVSTTQDKLQETEELQKERSPRQQPREIAQEVKQENLKITGDGESEESENTKDLFSEVKESESTLKEPPRNSLSDLIHKLKGVKETTKVEESKTEEEEEDREEHKEDKTSPDSIVMVEAKDTANMNKTPHKKSHGILSGVGSKVKNSISKVKKAITGKSSHTKSSSPQ